jgi:hypothetical protein
VRECRKLSLLGMPADLMPGHLQRWLGRFWSLVGDKSRLTAVASLTGGPPIGKQRWVGSQVPTECREMHLLSPNMRSRLLLLVSGPAKCMGLEPLGAKSMLLD